MEQVRQDERSDVKLYETHHAHVSQASTIHFEDSQIMFKTSGPSDGIMSLSRQFWKQSPSMHV